MASYSTIKLTDKEKETKHLTIQWNGGTHPKIYWKRGDHHLAHLQFNTPTWGHLPKKLVLAAVNEWNYQSHSLNESVELNIHDSSIQQVWKRRCLYGDECPDDFVIAMINSDADLQHTSSKQEECGLHIRWWNVALIHRRDHTIRLRSSTTDTTNPNGVRTWKQAIDPRFHVQLTTLKASNHFWHVLGERLSTQYDMLESLY